MFICTLNLNVKDNKPECTYVEPINRLSNTDIVKHQSAKSMIFYFN